MKIEIQVISTEIIHPSSPTPNDVSNYQISFLDQKHSPDFSLTTFYYKAATTAGSLNNSEISSCLKKSLPKTLSLYYPLAGRFVDGSNVNCNDEGITYIEAIANCTFFDIINDPIPHELDKLLPKDVADHAKDVCIKIQATFFKCGGFAIGVALSHKLADAQSLLSFLNCWAAISRDEDANNIRSPIFKGATLFPPKESGGNEPRIQTVSEEKIITKRFIFTASKINELRDKYTNTARATRVEALLGFIWTRFMVSTQRKDDHETIFTLLNAVSFRKRAVPPISDELLGNFVLPAIIVGDGEEGTDKIIQKMREAVRKIDGECISKLREGTQILDSLNDNANKFLNSEVEPFYFTSLCRFPLFEADFGWGKPVWISPGSGRFKNAVSFIDSSSGGGIEAWVYLEMEDMAKFEADKELLAYATT